MRVKSLVHETVHKNGSDFKLSVDCHTNYNICAGVTINCDNNCNRSLTINAPIYAERMFESVYFLSLKRQRKTTSVTISQDNS